ncbi:LysR substrate-binding domain-containing protein [Falsiroseomonas sp. HW251]|uniref:LysR substrate-binding domain-containing protein n=1 Tax=Falsiroseomonas sp. HW251 TaxID=3390998 RepID=UPI003D318102
MINLRSLDLNLLTVFEAVYEAGSITRAAERLALSVSATSHAMARLRDVCGDELFSRIGQGVQPTPVATRIYPEIRKALDLLRRSIAEARGFDPATSTREFAISIPHPLGPVWALAIREAALEAAPKLVLRFETRTLPVEQTERMRAGTLDLAVDWLPPADDRFVLRKLFDDHLVLVARAGHPRIGPDATAEAIRAECFVRGYRRPGPLSNALTLVAAAADEVSTDWRIEVSEALEIPLVVSRSDLLGYVPASMQKRAVEDFGLAVLPSAVSDVPIPILSIWHETRRSDEGHRWLRDFVAEHVMSLAG